MKKVIVYTVMFSLIMFLSADFVYAYKNDFQSINKNKHQHQSKNKISTDYKHAIKIEHSNHPKDHGMDIAIMTCIAIYVAVWTIFGIAMDIQMSSKCLCDPCSCGNDNSIN